MMWYVSELECLQECVCINISERESLCVNVQKTKSLCGLMCEGERKRGGESMCDRSFDLWLSGMC